MSDIKNLPLSSEDIKKLLNGKTKIILYPDLKKYKDIDSLLYPYNNVVILYINNYDENTISGH